MLCIVLKAFRSGDEIVSPGDIVDVPIDMLDQMAGYIQPKAWLTAVGELRTSADFIDPLPPVIVELTTDSLHLQRELLVRHCTQYNRHHFWKLAEDWQERAAIKEFDAGISREQAEVAAAAEYFLLAFLPELRSGDYEKW